MSGAVGAQFFLWDKRASAAPFAAVGRLPEEGNAGYVRYYVAIDPRREALERVPVGKLFTADEHFDGGRFRKSEFFNDFLVPYGVPYVAGSRVLESAGLSAVVAVLRNFAKGPLSHARWRRSNASCRTSSARLGCTPRSVICGDRTRRSKGPLIGSPSGF